MKLLLTSFLLWCIPAFSSPIVTKSFKDKLTDLDSSYSFISGRGNRSLVIFHGSGADHKTSSQLFFDLGERKGWNVLAIQAPNKAVSWSSNQHAGKFAFFANSLIQAHFKNAAQMNFVFVGISAGATFLMGDFLAHHIEAYQGDAVFLCGGGPPITAVPLHPVKNRQAWKFHSFISPDDFLYAQTISGISYWKSRAIITNSYPNKSSGHCNFSFLEAMKTLYP